MLRGADTTVTPNRSWIMNATRLTAALLAASAVLCGCPVTAVGQPVELAPDTVPGNGVVAGLGFGGGSKGLAGQLSVWGHWGKHTVGVRTAATSDFNLFGPSDSTEDYALLYGFRSGPGRVWGRVGIGPAQVRTVRQGDPIECHSFFFCEYETHRSSTTGLALQVEGVLRLFGPVGLGVTFFGNHNPESSFGGATLGLVIGSLGR